MADNTWHNIVIPCPKCLKKRAYETETWTHGGTCGGRLVIDSDGIVRCTGCGRRAHISQMKVSCNCGAHVKESVTPDEVASAFAIGIGMDSKNGSLNWFKRLLEHLK